ncbi:MAG: hypothetical protein Q7S46_04625 [Gallionella sp.]|nr:hypothetical protein [Gallionella sp.]
MKNILIFLALFLALFTVSTAFGQAIYGEKATTAGAIPASSIASKMKGLDSLKIN